MPYSTSSPNRTNEDVVAIIIPVFDDWDSLARLLLEIDNTLGAASLRAQVIVVDDRSTTAASDEFRHQEYTHLSIVETIRLHCNLGHQRAIAVGLAHLKNAGVGVNAVVVMDGDGEDRPEDIPQLITELSRQKCGAVFAARSKRSEGNLFRLMYGVYRLAYWLLTGISINFGNFSAISALALPGLLACPDLWNHYAGAVLRSRIRLSTLSLPRGRRYLGKSHMRLSNLVVHGLSAIAVFSELIAVRLIFLFSGSLLILMVLFGAGIFTWVYTSYGFLDWAVITAGVLIVLAMQGLLSALIFALVILSRRSQATIIPKRDALAFIESTERLFPVDGRDLRRADSLQDAAL